MTTETRKHAVTSPSAAERWTGCPGSLALAKDFPDESSPYAEEGTLAHRLAELTLLQRFRLRPLSAEEAVEFTSLSADDERLGAVRDYVDYVVKHAGEEPDFIAVEMPLDISGVTGEAGAHGTADCVAVVGTTLFIFDLKYGRGVEVEAERALEDDHGEAVCEINKQLGIYALAALDELDPGRMIYGVEQVEVHIVQPRMRNFSKGYVTVERLEKEREKFLSQAALARELYEDPAKVDPEKHLCANEHWCRFCRAKAVCPAFTAATQRAVQIAFEESEKEAELPAELKALPVPSNPEGLAKAFDYLPLVRMWADAVEAELMRRMTAGEAVPGLKLVEGRAGVRKWRDTVEAEIVLCRALTKGGAYEKKPLSPAKAEKAMKAGKIGPKHWKRLQYLMERADPKPVVAYESDPRPAWKAPVATAEDFEEAEALPPPEEKEPAAEAPKAEQAEPDPDDFI